MAPDTREAAARGKDPRDGAAETELGERLTIVLLTYNCAHRLSPILAELLALGVAIIAVDNGSCDQTADLLRAYHGIEVIALKRNIGAAARNVGAQHSTTPYVAFCDDDGWYERDGLVRAADALDSHPALGLINARIMVGDQQRLDPVSAEMADSPLLEQDGIPGAVLLGFMAGACITRAEAYLAVGGYDPEFFMGGEEEGLAIKLAAAGWKMRYRSDIVAQHRPSQANVTKLRAFGLRNALWTRWIYRRPATAATTSLRLLAERPKNRDWLVGVTLALRGLPWALSQRRPVDAELDRQLSCLDHHRPSFREAHRAHRITSESTQQ
ncbi:MAG: glycosyl transferase [Frankiales bacterium]|nr:glycosyl transferase [Frankiales bacterium]